MCTMPTRYWYKDSYKLLWHERYVLMVHLVQSGSPRTAVFGGSTYCQQDIASVANHGTKRALLPVFK